MDPVISNSFWIWLIVIGVWSLSLAMLDGAFIGDGNGFSYFGAACFIIFLLCIVVAAIAGTVTFIQYNQAWPFTPK